MVAKSTLILLAVTGLTAAGCVGEGAVEVRLQLPEDPELSPTELRINEITLITTMPGQPRRSETRRVDDPRGGVDLGRVDVSDGVELAIAMSSPSQRLVGFGRSERVNIDAEATVAVSINVRRPFVYLTGGLSITTFDSTQDQDSPKYRGAIGVSGSPAIVIPTPDGEDLAVVATGTNGATLVLVSTSTHLRREELPAIPLGPFPTDAAVSPDNRYLVVAHEENAGGQGGLSIIDLVAARAGQASVRFVPLQGVGAVSVGGDRAVALINRALLAGCQAGASSIVAVELDTPSQVGPTVSFAHGIHDMAVAADGQTVVVADSCEDALVAFDLDDDASRVPLMTLTDAAAVAIVDDRVWGVGTLPPTVVDGARLELVSVPIDGNEADMTRVKLPPTQERARSRDFNQQGQTAEQVLAADNVIAYELAVVPGAGHIALLTEGLFRGSESMDLAGFPIIPEMEMRTWEYLLVNAATTTIVQRQRTQCMITWDSSSIPWLDDWECGVLPGQEIANPTYRGLQLSVLYGSR